MCSFGPLSSRVPKRGPPRVRYACWTARACGCLDSSLGETRAPSSAPRTQPASRRGRTMTTTRSWRRVRPRPTMSPTRRSGGPSQGSPARRALRRMRLVHASARSGRCASGSSATWLCACSWCPARGVRTRPLRPQVTGAAELTAASGASLSEVRPTGVPVPSVIHLQGERQHSRGLLGVGVEAMTRSMIEGGARGHSSTVPALPLGACGETPASDSSSPMSGVSAGGEEDAPRAVNLGQPHVVAAMKANGHVLTHPPSCTRTMPRAPSTRTTAWAPTATRRRRSRAPSLRATASAPRRPPLPPCPSGLAVRR